jgi:hypothetical protein
VHCDSDVVVSQGTVERLHFRLAEKPVGPGARLQGKDCSCPDWIRASINLLKLSLWMDARAQARGSDAVLRTAMPARDDMRQNQRSLTSTVSPGLNCVPSGTTKRPVPEASLWVRVTLSRLARGEKPPAIATALSTLMFGT